MNFYGTQVAGITIDPATLANGMSAHLALPAVAIPPQFASALRPNTTQDHATVFAEMISYFTETDADGQGGIIQLPRGNYETRQPMILKSRFAFGCINKRSARIRFRSDLPGWPADFHVQLGPSNPDLQQGVFGFDAYLENVALDFMGSDIDGVITYTGQEGCGLRNVGLVGIGRTGFTTRGTKSANLHFYNVETYTKAGSNAMVGINLQDMGGNFVIHKATCVGGVSAEARSFEKAGICVSGAVGSIHGVHGEGCNDLILIEGNNVAVDISNITGPSAFSRTMNNLVHITGANKCRIGLLSKRSALATFRSDLENSVITDSIVSEIKNVYRSGTTIAGTQGTWTSAGTKEIFSTNSPNGSIQGQLGWKCYALNRTTGAYSEWVNTSPNGTTTTAWRQISA